MQPIRILGLGFGLLVFLLGAPVAHGQWSYQYYDDFSTNKAQFDSYDHSPFWEPGMICLDGYLSYTYLQGFPPPALAFCRGFELYGVAYVSYSFPLSGVPRPSEVWGTLEVDTGTAESDPYLAYAVSGDGTTWTLPMPLGWGHQQIPLGSSEGTCYVKLMGIGAGINNLHVALTPEPATLSLLALGGVALLGRRR